MQREIKFRGQRIDNGEFIYGSLSMVDTRTQRIGKNYGQMFICNVQTGWQNTENGKLVGYWTEVLPETVGQFTGMYDVDHNEIYESDTLEWTSSNPFSLGEKRNAKVNYIEARFWCQGSVGVYLAELLSSEKCRIVNEAT